MLIYSLHDLNIFLTWMLIFINNNREMYGLRCCQSTKLSPVYNNFYVHKNLFSLHMRFIYLSCMSSLYTLKTLDIKTKAEEPEKAAKEAHQKSWQGKFLNNNKFTEMQHYI